MKSVLDFFFQTLKNNYNSEKLKIIQTHASYLVILKPFVYKIKKNVNFGFLDFSSLEKRFYFSLKEIYLNQRLCKNLYINLSCIRKENNNISINPIFENKEIDEQLIKNYKDTYIKILNKFDSDIEFAIKMNFIEDRHFIKNQKINFEILQEISKKLFLFYDSTKITRKDNIKDTILNNLKDCKQFIYITLPKLMYRFIYKFNIFYFRKYFNKIKKRSLENWVRDCHGDLHLEHIIYDGNTLCIYDCIEFNDDFRQIDIANDVAFLCMDLEFYGYYRESYFLTKQFFKKYNNYDFIFLQDLYRCYRAFVRGKVYSLKILDKDINEQEKEKSKVLASQYFKLSFLYAIKDIHPTIFVFMGRIGSGKSTIARKFSEFLELDIFSSDAIRKSFFNLPLYEKTPENLKFRVYTKFITEMVYKTMIEKAIESSLKKGLSILDGTFANKYLRNLVLFRAFEENIKIIFIEIDTKKEIIIERLKKRKFSSNEVSDAGLEEFLSFYDFYEPPQEIPINQKIQIKIIKERSIETIFQYILKKIILHRFQYKHPY